jgi:hypothetical protein
MKTTLRWTALGLCLLIAALGCDDGAGGGPADDGVDAAVDAEATAGEAGGGAEARADATPAPAVDAEAPTPVDAAVRVDPGNVEFESTPAADSASATAAFTFRAAVEGATTECRLDAAEAEPCESPVAITDLEDGPHVFAARAVLGGRAGPWAEVAWTVDTIAPTVTIDAAPDAVTPAADVEVAFSADEPVAFQCALGGDAPAPCGSPWRVAALGEGAHTLVISATDAAGHTGEATAAWVVDRTAPETVLDEAPPPRVGVEPISLTFHAPDEPDARFECALDDAGFAPCESPWMIAALADGPHMGLVRALDVAGNADPSPARAEWTVDAAAPETVILSAPDARTSDDAAAFQLGPAGNTFECAVDGADFAPCELAPRYTGMAEGPHVFRARATDDLGNTDPTPARHEWIVDRTGPTARIVTGPAPFDRSATPVVELEADEPEATFECALDGGAFAPCPATHPLLGLDEGPHTIAARGVDSLGNAGPESAPWSWVTDRIAPETEIRSAPDAHTGSPDATVVFGADEAATFECRIDAGAWAQCESPLELVGLAAGPHTLDVRATDAAGNVDDTEARAAWIVWIGAPETEIRGGPDALTRERSATFELGPEGHAFECRLDDQPWQRCAALWAFDGLPDGVHRFEVIAIDPVGNRDPEPAAHTWTIDTRPPVLTALLEPPAHTPEPAVRIAWEADEPSTFECQHDDLPPEPCNSPRVEFALDEMPHAASVWGTDAAGNRSEPLVFRWTVDATPPNTVIVEVPPPAWASGDATFRIEPAGLTYECSLDFGETWAPCPEAHSVEGLEDGFYDLWARATDRAGNVDATPASWDWVVDRAAPTAIIEAGPPARTVERAAELAWDADEPGCTFECALDGADWSPCEPPLRLEGLEEAAHALAIRATDAAGNVQPQPTVHAWTIDKTPPAAPPVVAWPGDGTVLLEWPRVSEDEAAYRVERAVGPDGAWAPAHEGWLAWRATDDGGQLWLDGDDPAEVISNGTVFRYRVRVRDLSDFESEWSAPVEATPTLEGTWAVVPDVPVRAWHAAALPTGKIIMWQSGSQMRLFDPETETYGEAFQSPTNKFCSGMSMLADGRLLAVGGHESPTDVDGHRDWLGLPSAEIFDPFTETWTAIDDMPGGPRWYPTARTLIDGTVLVVGGIDQRFAHPHGNPNMDLYDPATNTWQTVAPRSNTLARTFPRNFYRPDGRMMWVGGQRATLVMDMESYAFTGAGQMSSGRGGGGFATMLGSGEVLYIGGGSNLATAELYDPDTGGWTRTPDMVSGRVYPNTALMPDGRVLITGGRTGNANVLDTEIYDRDANVFTSVGDYNYTHEYHSILLPFRDGRFIAAGDQLEAEIFTPWYLNAGPRPAITGAPEVIDHLLPFEVTVEGKLPVEGFSLVRIGGVTHAINSDQQYVTPMMEDLGDGRWRLTVMDNGYVAPPGYYMLWAMDGRGVPSRAVSVRLTIPTPPVLAPEP